MSGWRVLGGWDLPQYSYLSPGKLSLAKFNGPSFVWRYPRYYSLYFALGDMQDDYVHGHNDIDKMTISAVVYRS